MKLKKRLGVPVIKLNINIDPALIFSKIATYNRNVSKSLKEIATLIPDHKLENFKSSLWGKFKISIWEQQYHKCSFCEKEILSADDAQLEHFRPKAEARNENNDLITRESYWWLAYEHKNYIVSCFTCNNLKGNRFPIEDEDTRVKATDINDVVELNDDGVLADEIPFLVNPRYQDPEPYFAYTYRPDIKLVFIHPKDDKSIGQNSINILDLNRNRKNIDVIKDILPHKRGSVLTLFIKELESFILLKDKLERWRIIMVERPDDADLRNGIVGVESDTSKKRDTIIERFLSNRAQFSGMCSFWLKYATDLEGYFIKEDA